MKKIIFIIICFIVATNNLYSQKVVRIGAFNFYPAIFQDKDGEIKGFYVDAFHEIEVKENIQIQYIFGTWDEGLQRIKNDEIDMMVSVAYTADRATYMDYSSTPLITVWGEVYVNKSSEIDGILSLEGKKIAVMRSDANGEQLKILTKKMSINCIFIEKPDFQKVFESIVSNEVDAGVVNNTFGASKSEEYDIRSSGIVFNPFDIHLTVHKNKNAELLKLFDSYLITWKYDVNSVYNTSRKKWSHGKVGAIQIIPKWLENGLISIFGITIILVVFIVLLRYRVKKATIKVKNSEALFKTFMENSTAYVYIKDESLNHIYSNQKVEELINNSTDEKPSSATSIFDIETVKLLEKADRKILNSEVDHLNLIYSGIIKNKKRWFHDYKFHLSSPNEKPMIGGVALDITKLKETEEELHISKNRYDLAMAASMDGIYDWNLVTNEIYYSPGWKSMLGYEDDELPNDFSIWENLIEPEDAQKSWKMQQELIHKQLDRFEFEFKMKHKDGHWVDILSRAEAVFDENNKAIRIVGTHVDISQRKQAEKELIAAKEKAEESENYLDSIINSMGDPVFVKDDQSRILLANNAFCTLFGLQRDQIVGKTLAEDVTPEEQESFLMIDKQVLTDGKESINLETLTIRDGQTMTISIRKTRYIDTSGRKFLIGVIRDITDHKLAEEKIQDQLNELRRWNEAMLNREERVMELKREVNELLRAEGKSARYASAADKPGDAEQPYHPEV